MYKQYQPQQQNGGGGVGFRKEESVAKALSHTCLGRIIILAGFGLVLLIVAYITAPTESEMQREMEDNMIQCLEEHGKASGDLIDDFVHNITFTLTDGDSVRIPKDMWIAYRKYNCIESYRHNFYSTTYLYNNMHPKGVRVGIGIFFIVIPTINYPDILLDVAPMHKGYNQKLIKEPDEIDSVQWPEIPQEPDLSDVQIKGYDYEDE